uniref:Uncharacterized protein n=1 Tax=Meloidogyne enterolobii TaxID=390850 RepID=A0A6V7XXT5_MELEN|nr:unnamed protein product [Meloidogyne enterolobii]
MEEKGNQCILDWYCTTIFFRGIAVGVFAVGGMIGGNLVGIVATKLESKRALLYNNALAIIAGTLMAGAKFCGKLLAFYFGPSYCWNKCWFKQWIGTKVFD